jgi:hypothetical protein
VGRLLIIVWTSERLRRVRGGSSWKGDSRSGVRVSSESELGWGGEV